MDPLHLEGQFSFACEVSIVDTIRRDILSHIGIAFENLLLFSIWFEGNLEVYLLSKDNEEGEIANKLEQICDCDRLQYWISGIPDP